MCREKRIATIVTIVLIVLAIIIAVCIVMRMQGIQPFRHLNMPNRRSRTETIRRDIEEKPKATEEPRPKTTEMRPKDSVEEPTAPSFDTRIIAEEAVYDGLDSPVSDSSSVEEEETPKVSRRATHRVHSNLPVYKAATHWDLFTPKEDTMRLYGVSQDELDKLVEQYRKEQKYEIEAAPTTLTFNLDKWERATDAMQDSMRNVIVQPKPFEDGLVDMLYKEGDY